MADPAGVSDFGRYQLGESLGRGGMGEVFRARDTGLERDVAIKFVAADKLTSPDARARLRREAKAVAALDHPGICQVYDDGVTPDGRGYIVMQLVEGESLSATLRERGRLGVREALDLTVQVADALGAAHRRNIVHRDLKPSNIMVDASGRARLLDFGIAKIITVRGSEETTVSGHTAPYAIVGTTAYMSPEQVQRRPVDGRSDLFALGVLLYECLTGRRPFDAPTAVEIFANIIHKQPPAPSTLRPELEPTHDALCARLLAKEPADRFQSANEVVGAIRLMLHESGTVPQPTPTPNPWSRRLRLAAAGAGAVAAAALGVWFWSRRRAASHPAGRCGQTWYRPRHRGLT